MSDERPRSVDTSFASAARADVESLGAQRRAFLSDPVAVALLDAMPGPAMVLNSNRQIVGVNGVLRTAFGVVAPERVVGLRPGEALECVHGDERPGGCGTTRACSRCGAVSAVLECLTTTRRATRECRIRTRRTSDGGALDLRVHATYVVVGGEPFVVVGIEDISGEKRRRVLERALFRDLEHTCAGMHDVAERLECNAADPQADAEDRSYLRQLSDIALDQISRQRILLGAECGSLMTVTADVDLVVLMKDLVRRHQERPLARERCIRLEHTRRCELHTDPTLLARALGDLLENALEATPVGGTVSISCETDRRSATFSIHNSGVIPPDVQLQIFQRSFSTREGHGRGIGTYGAKLIVERYLGGDLEFVSNDRVGTLFVIVLPDLSRRHATTG